jgi:hypothetical protein
LNTARKGRGQQRLYFAGQLRTKAEDD